MLDDDVIILRPFKEEDAEEHLRGEDEEQIKWLSGGKSSLELVKNWIKKNKDYWQKGGPVFNFAIIDKTSNKLVGMVEANTGYEKIEGIENGNANISYGIYPQFRGKGYAQKAINLLLDFLKSKQVKRAVIRTNPQNPASMKVAQRLGFEEKDQITKRDREKLKIFVKTL